MIQKPLQELLRKHRAFWNQEQTEFPLLGFTTACYFCREEFSPVSIPTDRYLTPQDFDVDVFLELYNRQYIESQKMAGDQIWTACPPWAVLWMEAIVGCPLRSDEKTIWTEPFLKNILDQQDVKISLENPWFQKLLEFTTKLVDQSDGRYPVGIPFMDGPLDILSAMVGPENAMVDFYDHPDEACRLIQTLADLWIQVAEALLSLIPAFRGGYCGGFRQVWAPGKCPETQDDAMAMFSPDLYRELALPGLRRIMSRFDYPSVHLHSCSLQHLDTFLAIPELAAVEITADVGGLSVPELIPLIAKSQRQKPTIVHGKFTTDEMRQMIQGLGPEGLWIITRVDCAEVANEMFRELMVNQ